MYLVTADEMRELDRRTIEEIGIPALVLMENAARAVAEEVMQLAKTAGPRWLIMAGKGNNGGDGLAVARHLLEAGLRPMVVLAADPQSLSGEAAAQYGIAQRLGIPCRQYGEEAIDWREWDGIVDALLGTGTKGRPRGAYADMIAEANRSGRPIVSVDIPSGLDADTGQAEEPCIRATLTVTLAFKKRGLAQYPGASFAGKTVVRPIGIIPRLAREMGVQTFEVNAETLEPLLGIGDSGGRAPDSHKGTYGHVMVAAGSRAMSGAGLLAASAALRGGCGLVTWAVPDSLVPSVIGRQPELMIAGVPDGGRADWSRTSPNALLASAQGKQALVIGPGMGRWEGDAGWLRTVWEGADLPLVVDADALNMIADADGFSEWPRRHAPTVFTPHPGEMARLAGISTKDVQRDRIETALRYAVRHNVTVALKGAGTVCASPSGIAYVNTTGNPGMATAGAGDVLAGIIGALLAQGMPADQAAALAVYRHGAAGDRAAAKRHAPDSLIAGDLLAEL